MWVKRREFKEFSVEAGAPQILKCHYGFGDMSAEGLKRNLVRLNY